MRWTPLVLLLVGCETNEVRAWNARRAELTARRDELAKLETQGYREQAEALRTVLDLPGFVRGHRLPARVFLEPGLARLTFSGTVDECRDVVSALAELRWLTSTWRLRLENGRCEWEARTGAEFKTLEDALVAPPSRWAAPPSQLFSSELSEVKKGVAVLEADVRAREAKLGASAVLGARVEAVQPLVDSLRARPPPCDLAILERERALDAPEQGRLLEVEQSRLVHPLEPRTDFRLRGLVEVNDASLLWRCEDP